SQRALGTRSVMLVHHTNCGLESLTEDFNVDELETLEVAQGVALPEMGASSGSIGTSSSSSSTCSAC
ncbi:thiazolylpeptide-type bacteriocin, partial [Streptomyces tanashiensis]